ncbi:mucin-2 [Anopheles ziemanni]|uniref:mucin-2 n=1 Tax=Anopheles coustani TaxID=139045 RepID=UPI002659FCE7|nr:mucin-2 [Anopheles coustani]XP_058178155.1 mucin-2 [Anopheles ziemanni]
MVGERWLLFALFAIVALANGAKRGPGGCKNCIKNQLGHHDQRLIASPINLLNPDRYEFFTLDDKGKVVKRIMTFKEIQSIVAGSDNSGFKLMENTNNNDRIVSSVVSNVRNVLNNELNLMHSQDSSSDHHNSAAELPISEMINDQDEASDGSSVEYTQDKSTEESPEVTTRRPTEQTTVRVKEQPTESTTKRWTSKTTTTRPTESTIKFETVRTTERTTIRPTISSTERTTEPSTMRSTESSTIRTTTEKVQPTTESPVRSTTEQPKVRLTTPASTTAKSTERTTIRSTVRPTTEQSTTQKTTVESVQKLSTERQSTTTTTVRPTETPILKQAERSTTTVKPTTEKLKITEASTVTTSTTTTTTTTTTTGRPTEKIIIKATNKPLPTSPAESSSTEKSSEQSGDYSTLRSEEATNGSSMEYSTEDSSEKSGYEQSSEATRYTEVKSSVGSTVGLKTPATIVQSSTVSVATKPTSSIVITTESGKVSTTVASKPSVSPSTPLPTKYEVVSSTTKAPPTPSPLGAFEALKDLVGMVLNTDSEEITTPSSSTLPNDLVAHYVTNQGSAGVEPEKKLTTSYAKPATLPEVTTVETIALEETIPTTTSVETDASTFEDSTGYGSEESGEVQQSTEVQLDRETTAIGTDVTYKPSQTESDFSGSATTVLDSSTIPSDAQHAIHKIIESLQSINDDSNASDESESEISEEEQSYPMDMAGLNYDTDAQSSINAIIQSLGQGSLVSGENSLLATTTEIVTTTEEVPSTVSRAPERKTTVAVVPITSTTPVTTTTSTTTTTTTTARTTSTAIPTTSKVVLKTSAPAIAVEKEPSSSGLNFNTNIMETIEKFLSKFANLPSDETYSMNLTKFNPLSNYPADLNMTDYVDRTATVASVLKFPQTRPLKPIISNEGEAEVEQREDPPNRPPQSLTTQSLLNETVASFMKLGEMLTMANGNNNNNNRINSGVEPQEGSQLELKTVVDEEETELLRFLSICGNLGTNVYDYLTGSSAGERSLEGRSLVYSPFATITTLSMLFLGTRGASAESINGVIGLDEMTSFNPHLFFKSIVDDLKPKPLRRSTIPGVEEQRGSFFSRTLLSDKTRGGLQRFFKARIQEIYSAVAETVDFQQKDTLLKHLSGDFPRDYVGTLKHLRSPLVSISRNRYRHDCNDATTYGVMNFKQSTASADSTITIPSVSFRSGFSTGFSNTLDATVLSLPGATSNVSVFFLKPSTPGGLTDLETHIRTQSVSAVLKLFPDETVRTAYAEVQLPYFTQTTMYNMSRSIQQLGLQNLFQPNVANFNGLQDSAVSNLHLSETVQTDSFALCASEAGTGRGAPPFRSFSTNLVRNPSVDQLLASASSDKLVRRNRRKILYRDRSAAGAPRAQESKLTFDTPFLYLVRHNPTGLVLYMGRFVGNNSDK